MGPQTSHTPELLAPASGQAQLEAAIRFGADAIYLACDRFGMRQRADNFTLESVSAAIAYAHAADVPVYVTLNTLMDSDDIALLPEYCEQLAAAGADAFIVSDLGALAVARRCAPQVALHVSTQASVMNAEAACMWYELGARRVVCAREMSVQDIARMREGIPDDMQLEVFVHGALCVAMSGRCLLSAAMTGRSANRGECAQSCRWGYALVEEKRPGEYFPIEEDTRGTYVMNAQDLNMIEHLDDLRAAGVDAFKIEGRNKKVFYVAAAVHAYRAVLDGADPAKVMPELLAISHRPYGTGFYYGQPNQTPEQDGYLKERLHAATVETCEAINGTGKAVENERDETNEYDAHERYQPSEETRYRATASCYNRFCEGEEVEVLSPHRERGRFFVQNLAWLPEDSGPVPVDVANRTLARYEFETTYPLEPGDLLSVAINKR